MPGIAVHLRLARAVLDDLNSWPDPPPFPVDDPACRGAFYAGSCAPDIGYFPGGDRLLSDLAHYVRSADLLRNLLRLARTPGERATAWGWATHLLGDVLIHPLINRAAGALLGLGPGRTIDFDRSPWAHIRVELGLDAHCLAGFAGVDGPASGLDRAGMVHLDRGFSATYGHMAGLRRFRTSHRAFARFSPWLLAATRSGSGASRGRGLRERSIHLARRASDRFANRSVLFAITHPLPPSAWLISEFEAAIASFPARFLDLSRSGCEQLANYNLDTGDLESEAPDYPPRTRAIRALRERIDQARTS